MNYRLHAITMVDKLWDGTSDLFTSYEMELETHVHVQIEKQLGFHEHQIACYHYGWQVSGWN